MTLRPDLLEILACPQCKQSVELSSDGAWLVCAALRGALSGAGRHSHHAAGRSPAPGGLSLPKTLTSDPRRALIVKLGHIGDVLVTTPVISALKERWPDLAVDMVVNPGTEAMVVHNPQVNQVMVLRREHAGPLAAAAWHLGFFAPPAPGGLRPFPGACRGR